MKVYIISLEGISDFLRYNLNLNRFDLPSKQINEEDYQFDSKEIAEQIAKRLDNEHPEHLYKCQVIETDNKKSNYVEPLADQTYLLLLQEKKKCICNGQSQRASKKERS